MNKKQRKVFNRIIISAAVFILGVLLQKVMYGYIYAVLLSGAYIIIGHDVLYKAGRNIVRGQVFDENFLMAIATIGAMLTGEYPEAVFVMLFYQVGELFQSIAVGKSRKSIASLMEIRPDYADVERNGEVITVDPSEVIVGETIVIRPGEKIALDGVITDGSTSIDTKALTGESVPMDCSTGDTVISGCVNLSGVIKVQVTKQFSESTVSKILELVENSSTNKSKSENFITRFARVYTPIVVVCAVCLALFPPLFIDITDIGVWKEWIYRALTFLVISCPCALVISVPLSFFGGIGGMSKQGILTKGSNYIEAMAECKTVVFDKTGTLTYGKFRISECTPHGCDKSELLEAAAIAESFSNHPIAAALKNSSTTTATGEELAGLGVRTIYGDDEIYAGNSKLMSKIGITATGDGTVVHVAKNGRYMGYITVEDTIKQGAKEAIIKLKSIGIERIVMLTGDKKDAADVVAHRLGIDEVYSQLLPSDKVDITERLLNDTSGKLAFVGDGINDAPVLVRADIGFAMGALGSDAAIEAADVVLMDDSLMKISTAIEMSKFTRKIVKQNILFTLFIKAAILICGALGITGMWAAVFADVGVAVIAILNAMRTLKSHK